VPVFALDGIDELLPVGGDGRTGKIDGGQSGRQLKALVFVQAANRSND
jgi:hypothetical protein